MFLFEYSWIIILKNFLNICIINLKKTIKGGNEYTRIGGDFKYIHWVYDDRHEEEILTKNN